MILEERFKGLPVLISTPFTDNDQVIKDYRRAVAVNMVAKCMNRGIYAFSPIAYGISIISFGHKFPDTWEFWQGYCEAFVSACKAVFVIDIPGWDKSTGVKGEIDHAIKLGLPVYLIAHDDNYETSIKIVKVLNEGDSKHS